MAPSAILIACLILGTSFFLYYLKVMLQSGKKKEKTANVGTDEDDLFLIEKAKELNMVQKAKQLENPELKKYSFKKSYERRYPDRQNLEVQKEKETSTTEISQKENIEKEEERIKDNNTITDDFFTSGENNINRSDFSTLKERVLKGFLYQKSMRSSK